MHMFKRKYGYLCVADPNIEQNNKVNIIRIEYDEQLIRKHMQQAEEFWKANVYPLLLKSVTKALRR